MGNETMKYVSFDETVITELLQHWQNQWTKMSILALVPEAERSRIPQLQRLCQQLNIPLAGAVFPALLTDDGWTNTGIWLLRLNPQPSVFLFENVSTHVDIANYMARKLDAVLDPSDHTVQPALFMIFDSMLPNTGSIVENLYVHLADRVSYAGVNAGSETFQPIPCLFD